MNLVYYGNQRQLEYDFVVSPGADPRAITLAFERMDGLAIDSQGDLVLRADAGEVRLRKPVVYQDHDGQRTVIPSRYVMKGERQVAFEVAAYDGTQPLIIDPVLAYSTYLGGFGGDEGVAIAVGGILYRRRIWNRRGCRRQCVRDRRHLLGRLPHAGQLPDHSREQR